MKFTEKQIETMWNVLCSTQGVPRMLGGLPPRERRLLVSAIKKQQRAKIPLENPYHPFERLPEGGPPDTLQYLGVDYAKVVANPFGEAIRDVAPDLQEEARSIWKDGLGLHSRIVETVSVEGTGATDGNAGDTDGATASAIDRQPATHAGDDTQTESSSPGNTEESPALKAAYDW